MFTMLKRSWLLGAPLALIAILGLAGCDLSSLTGLQCTPQTCDYTVNSLAAVKGASGVTLLADTSDAVYQYSGSQWNKVGDANTQSRGTLFVSPNFAQDQTLFLGNLLSNDGGKSFTTLCVTTIGISPNFSSDHTVFGKDVNNSPVSNNGTPVPTPTNCPTGSGSYFASQDGGKSWSAVQGPQGAGDPDLFAVSPNYGSSKTLFATFTVQGASALYKSTDAGQSWSKILDSRQNVLAVSPNYGQDQTVIAVANDHVRRSTDGGQSWQNIDGSISPSNVAEIDFSPNYAQDQTILMVSSSVDQGSSTTHGTFITKDGGKTWSQSGQVTQRGENFPAILFSPNYSSDKTIYTSSLDQGKGPAFSTDLGQNWTAINSGLQLQGQGG
jgi:photosystem II stability/assembly factor-like uncharacterized protein